MKQTPARCDGHVPEELHRFCCVCVFVFILSYCICIVLLYVGWTWWDCIPILGPSFSALTLLTGSFNVTDWAKYHHLMRSWQATCYYLQRFTFF